MSITALIAEIDALPVADRLKLIEHAARSIRHSEQADFSGTVELMRTEYLNDPELTAFSALDGEDFYEAK